MNLNKRLEKLEKALGSDNQIRHALLVPDLYNEGSDAAIERWKIENGPAPENAFFIVLATLK